jgi:hypothetical protein
MNLWPFVRLKKIIFLKIAEQSVSLQCFFSCQSGFTDMLHGFGKPGKYTAMIPGQFIFLMSTLNSFV